MDELPPVMILRPAMLRHALLPLLFTASLFAEPVRGVIRETDPKAGTLTLEREDTKERITALVGAGDLAPERLGTIVTAELRRSGKTARLENLVPADAEGLRIIAETSARLHKETEALGRSAVCREGDPAPEFALRDQFGRLLTKADLKGRHVVVSFIFTRCRMPEMCPASTRKMVELTRKLKEAGANALSLSISFDPLHDTPGVFKSYADAYGADHLRHRFLTGPKGEITDLQRRFGILTVNDDGDIVHNVATTLVGPDGRVLLRLDGPKWSPDEILERVRRDLPAK